MASEEAYGDSNLIRIQTVQERRRGDWVDVQFRIGSNPDGSPIFTTVRAVLHRPLSAGQIKWVKLLYRQIGTQYDWKIVFTIAAPPEPLASDPAKVVAVDLGWRKVLGGLRVAYWIGSDGQEGEVQIPDRLLDSDDVVKNLESIRDKLFDGIRETLSAWIHGDPLPPWVNERIEWLRQSIASDRGRIAATDDARIIKRLTHGIRAKTAEQDSLESLRDKRETVPHVLPEWHAEQLKFLSRWRSKSKLMSVTIHWREHRFDGDQQIIAVLESWRKRERHLYDWCGFQRTKRLAWRNSIYRTAAKMLSERYGSVVIETPGWAKLQKNAPVEKDAADDESIKYNQRIAAVSILSRYMAEKMRLGIVDPKELKPTQRCSACGELDKFDKPSSLFRVCSHCGVSEDQDKRACRNILNAAASGSVTWK